MTETQFYVFLPSNASLDLYRDNTLSSYTVHLPEPIVLEGEYEVGLQCIIWPRTFYNITKTSWYLYYEHTSTQQADTILLSEGHYDTIKDLIDHINEWLRKTVSDNIQLTYNPTSEKVSVSVKNEYRLLLRGKLSQILGFGGERKVISKSQISPFVTDLDGGMQCLYIYADISGY